MIELFAGSIFIIVIIVSATIGVSIVPQGYEWVVERLGKFNRTLKPGINFIIPYIDKIAHKVPTKEIIIDTPPQDVITRDNAVIVADAVAWIRVISPEKAVYEIDDYKTAIKTRVQTSLRGIIGEMDFDDAISSRDLIKSKIANYLYEDVSKWGLSLKTVEIEEFKPSEGLQKSMAEQYEAERHRRAVVTRAEGEKSAAILEAEGRLEASRRDAEAKKVMAEADQRAIQMLTEVIGENDLPLIYLLGERYVDAIKDMATSENSKMIVVPADLPASIRGIINSLVK